MTNWIVENKTKLVKQIWKDHISKSQRFITQTYSTVKLDVKILTSRRSVCKINYQWIGATAVCLAQYFTAWLLYTPCFCSVQPDAGDEASCCFLLRARHKLPTPRFTRARARAHSLYMVADHNSAKCNIFRSKVTRQYTRQAKEQLDLVPNLCRRVQKQEGDILRRHTCSTISQAGALAWLVSPAPGIFSMKRLFCRHAPLCECAKTAGRASARHAAFRLVFAQSVRYARGNFAYYLLRLRRKSCYWASEWAERAHAKLFRKSERKREIYESLYLLHCETWSTERAALSEKEIKELHVEQQSFTICLYDCLLNQGFLYLLWLNTEQMQISFL